MAASFKDIEKELAGIFVDKAPSLPEGAKRVIVRYLPYLNLIAGILALFGAYGLWRMAHEASRWVDYANSISRMYGGMRYEASGNFGLMVWASLVVLGVEAAICIAAFPATKARRKKGWDMLFYALLVNVLYGVIVMFTDYGNVGSLVGSVVGTIIGLYVLFQIRGEYLSGGKGKEAR